MARSKNPEATIDLILKVSTELFMKKGYDKTTIQNIIDETGLSKGAVYHHFKSKEEIIIKVCNNTGLAIIEYMESVKKASDMTGAQKIREIFIFALRDLEQVDFTKSMAKSIGGLLDNPKFLALQMKNSMYEVAPLIVLPLIEDGIADGSIQTEYPKQLAEIIILMINIWINPYIFNCTEQEMYNKLMIFKDMMKGVNLDIFDDKMLILIEEQRRALESEQK